MQPLFITATGTNIGKTFVTLRLIETLSKAGIRVGVCKPIETGVEGIPQDAARLLEACSRYNSNFAPLSPADITAYAFSIPAAPFCADTQKSIRLEKIHEKIAELSGLCDLLLIEGAGGLMVPVTAEYDMIDLIEETGSRALLVSPSRLGCINDARLSIGMLQSRDIDWDWCVNLHEDLDSFAVVTQPYYDHAYPQWWSVQEGLERYVKGLVRG